MKKLLLIIVLYYLPTGIRAQEKVYYVGHSLVNLDMPYMVQQIVANAGKTSDYRHHINIGTGLKMNWIDTGFNGNDIWNPDLMMNVEFGTNHLTELLHPYQHIVITESVPLITLNRDTSIKYGANFFNLARANSPSCKKYLYATWEDDAHNLATWKPLIQSLKTEWEAIADGLATVSGGDSVYIVPGNIALLSLADSIASGGSGSINSLSEFFNPDGIHLNADGNYFIACLMAAVVYRVNPVGQAPVHSGPYKPLSDSTISNDINRLKIQQLAVAVACSYARTGAQSLCSTVGLPTLKVNQSEYNAYPNPVSNGQLIVESSKDNTFVFTTISGQQLIHGNIKKGLNNIDLRNVKAGLYFIQIGNKSTKIIVH